MGCWGRPRHRRRSDDEADATLDWLQAPAGRGRAEARGPAPHPGRAAAWRSPRRTPPSNAASPGPVKTRCPPDTSPGRSSRSRSPDAKGTVTVEADEHIRTRRDDRRSGPGQARLHSGRHGDGRRRVGVNDAEATVIWPTAGSRRARIPPARAPGRPQPRRGGAVNHGHGGRLPAVRKILEGPT
jgi:hypothetical protein